MTHPLSLPAATDRPSERMNRLHASEPQAIGDILAELMARRGYARVQSGQCCAEAWREAAGEALAARTRAGAGPPRRAGSAGRAIRR